VPELTILETHLLTGRLFLLIFLIQGYKYTGRLFKITFILLLIFYKSRPLAVWGIVLMLIAFLPVHIRMISETPLKSGNMIVTPLVAWIRLVILQQPC
jgi:uncharacterized membrane protein